MSGAAGDGSGAAGDGSGAAGDGMAQRLATTVADLTAKRAPHGSICPSEVARVVGGDAWRGLMERTREVVRAMAQQGEVVITQGGEVIDPTLPWRGPIRVRQVDVAEAAASR